MKKIFGMLFAAVIVVSLMMVPAALVGANPEPGIAGSWHLDEGIGSTATDSSAYGNDGTLSGGKFGNALSFDGVDDILTIPHSTSLNLDTAITVEAWIKADTLGAQDAIIRKGLYPTDPARSWGLDIHDIGGVKKARFFIYDGGQAYVAYSGAVSAGTWHHLVGTYDGQTIDIYLDGSNASSTPVSHSGDIDTNTAPITIGKRNGGRFFDGLIDEVRISDTVRYPAGFTPPTAPFLSDTNTVGLWHFDESVSSTAYDSSPNGNDGTLYGGTSWAGPVWTSGKSGNALSFDGIDDYVRVPDSTSLEPSHVTVEAWIKRSGSPGHNKYIVGKHYGSGWNSYALRAYSSGLQFYIGTTSAWYPSPTSGPVWDGNWHYVVGTFDGSDVRLYVDGIEVGMGGHVPSGTSIAYDGAGVNIGVPGDPWLGGPYHFGGNIDEVRIWDRALSSSEIAVLAGKPLALDHFLGYKVKTTKVCDGGVTLLTLKYLGDTTVGITVTTKDGVVFSDSVASGAEFSFGEEGVKLGTSIDIFVNDVLATTIHTSCSQPIYQGLTYGSFEVVEGKSLKGGPLETPAPKFEPLEVTLTDQFATGLFKVEKPDKLYNPVDKNGEGINDPNTHLMSYKVKPVGTPQANPPFHDCAPCKGGLTSLTLRYNGSSSADVVVTGGSEPFEKTLDPGEEFTIVGGGKDGKLDKDVTITVGSGSATTIHTSCSQPIGTGQAFGDFVVVEGESKDGGPLCPIIKVESQFGTIFVTIDKPDRLLVPTAKSLTGPVDPLDLDLTGVDHFLGYKIKAPKDMAEFEVMLVDQFDQPKWYVVKKPTRLFVPVDKDGEEIKNPEAHLICYTIKPAKGEPKHINVLGIYTNNQFGPLKLNTDKEEELLVPCTKILP